MSLTCIECGHTFEIDKSKIPSSTFNVKCPNCNKVFQARAQSGPDQLKTAESMNSEAGSKPSSWEQFKPEVEALVKKQLDFVQKDILLTLASLVGHPLQAAPVHPAGYSEKRALVCEPDPAVAQQLVFVLQRLGYAVQICTMMSEALGRLESGFYDVITTNLVFPDDPEGGQKILAKVNGRKTDERRKMFVGVVSDQIKTLPPQSAFFQGANISVQKSDLRNFESLLQEGLRFFREMYSNFYQLQEESTERL